MYIIMDMGTSNTRLWLIKDGGVLALKKGSFGAGSSKTHGKSFLYDSLKGLLCELTHENSISEKEIECILVSGMAGSELGLLEIPHISLPADIYRLSDSLTVKNIPEISEIPFIFVPGLRQICGDTVTDIMRGEETETSGIISTLAHYEDTIIVLPGTHNKIICVNASGEISEFHTTLSGELLAMAVSNSILAGQVKHDFNLSEADLLRGAAYAKENGLNSALFHIRVMAKNGGSSDVLSSFLYGAVIGQDIPLIKRIASGKSIYVGGKESLKKAYCALLGSDACAIDTCTADNAVLIGLQSIYKLYRTRITREKVLASIEREKLIAIIRAPEKQSFLPAMHALYDGGIRLAEITFDRSGKIPKEETAALISLLHKEFDGKMLIGAGTVTTVRDVMLAYNAGASFIISPNCDREIISLTRKLGLVSIPAAFTPTEIAECLKYGADYIKLFPADEVSEKYIKSVKAPLSDAKILAVGGVNSENAKCFIENGFCGIGVGSGIYNKELICKGNFSALKELAQKYVSALNGKSKK